MKRSIADQIKDLENTRAAKEARMLEVSSKASDEGRTMDDAEAEEFDTLEAEVKAVDADIARFRKLEQLQAAKAQPVAPKNTTGAPTVFIPKQDPEDKFKGQSYVRRLIAKAVAREQGTTAAEVAKHRWGKTHPQLVEVIKSGVPGGDIQSGDWGAELVQADSRYTGDFIEYLYSQTVYDKLGLREVPANVVIKGQDGPATGNWIGSGLGIKVSAQDYSTVSLSPLKVAAMSVVTKELLRYSSPSAEMLVRDSLVQASSQVIDTTFLSTSAAVPTVSPAGILASPLTSLGSNGYTADALREDIKELYAPFIASKYDLSGLTFVMHPSLAKAISLLANAFGQQEFPGINADGGTLLGDRVVTGHNVNATTIILLDPRNIWRIGDMGVEVSMSDQATIEQDGDPAGDSETPTAASATLMSMFGQDSVAFKVVRPVNFQKRRSTAAQFISDAQYGNSSSTTA